MSATQTRIENIYADLKLADRMTPGRTPWQTLRKRAEAIAQEEANGDYLSEQVVYGGEITTRGAMIADLHLQAVAVAAEASVRAARVRDEKIRAAHAEGATLRAIAEAAGLSHGRVFQIVNHR